MAQKITFSCGEFRGVSEPPPKCLRGGKANALFNQRSPRRMNSDTLRDRGCFFPTMPFKGSMKRAGRGMTRMGPDREHEKVSKRAWANLGTNFSFDLKAEFAIEEKDIENLLGEKRNLGKENEDEGRE